MKSCDRLVVNVHLATMQPGTPYGAIHEGALARAREALGKVRFSADFAEGQQLSAGEAVAPLEAGPATSAP